MVDLKYTQHRIECFNKIKKRLADMKPGNELLVAELLFIALDHGFTYKLVGEVVETYKDMGIITVLYEDGRAHKISKPFGEVYSHG
jgi:hypothetical protein